MYRISVCALFIVAISACTPPSEGSGEAAPSDDARDVIAKSENKGIEFGIGDVDAYGELSVRLGEESASRNVRATERKTERENLARVDVDVRPPHPDELFLTVMFITQTDYAGDSVAGTVRIFVEGEEVETIPFLWGGRARQERIRHTFDVLEGVENLPETMLVHATVDLVLFKNTDKSTLDIAALPASNDGKVTRMSNPVRIRFLE